MNKKVLGILVVLVIFSAAALTAADPCEGYWKSIDEETGEATAFWRIYTQGNKLFGEIVKITDKPDDTIAENVESSYKDFPVNGDLSKGPVLGVPWIYNLEKRRTGHWRRGNIIDPNDGKNYGCEIIFHERDGDDYMVDTLEVRGKILFFYRAQEWERSSKAEVDAFVSVY
ncbi:MAG: DUF2147 domain-containing protein [Spirochaetales bacterium]|nr:DUF2147 domain-containing protein [Spirochaetales bacterium]